MQQYFPLYGYANHWNDHEDGERSGAVDRPASIIRRDIFED